MCTGDKNFNSKRRKYAEGPWKWVLPTMAGAENRVKSEWIQSPEPGGDDKELMLQKEQSTERFSVVLELRGKTRYVVGVICGGSAAMLDGLTPVSWEVARGLEGG